jgi:hypothetical protein
MDRKREYEAVMALDKAGGLILERIGACRARVHDRCGCADDLAFLKALEAMRARLWPHSAARR